MANVRIQIRRDYAAKWLENNPLLASGEQGYEIDTTYMKVGDGVTLWEDLAYWNTLYTDDLTLKNPGDYVADCNVPDGNGLKTQADANKWFYQGIAILDEKLCIAQKEIVDIENQIQQLENAVAIDDVEANTIDIADLKARVPTLEQAIAILETEIEALAVQVNENSADIEALKIAILDLNQEIEELKDWIKAHSLEDHIDVELAAPTAGDYFVYKNGKWTNEAQCNMKCNTYIPSLATL